MSGKIFTLRDGEGLTELTQTDYENEDLFQSLIEKYPAILAGEQINPENPRKWVLISREMGVPLDDGTGWLDHLRRPRRYPLSPRSKTLYRYTDTA